MELNILLQAAAEAAEKGFFDPSSTFYHVCGMIASIGLICGFVPQAVQTIRTRNTDGIALPTFLMSGIGSMGFMMQGIMLGAFGDGAALFFTNLATTTSSFIIFCIKVYNDYFKDKKKQ